jgi:hypothetical protein
MGKGASTASIPSGRQDWRRLCLRKLIRRIQALLCHNVAIEYGSTETSLIAFARYDQIAKIPSAVGFPAPGVGMKLSMKAIRRCRQEPTVWCDAGQLISEIARC